VIASSSELEEVQAREMVSTAANRAYSKAFLDSWKEIAVFLKRGVRTVQRWEKDEGLPVHRHQHSKRASVYGVPWEIEAWFKGRAEIEVTQPPTGDAFRYAKSSLDADELVRACLNARRRAERARGQFSPMLSIAETAGTPPGYRATPTKI
jgi:hypothetical protein